MKRQFSTVMITLLCLGLQSTRGLGGQGVGQGQQAVENVLAGEFQWTLGRPSVVPLERPGDTCYSVKDPSIVHHGGRWHLFSTIRGKVRSHQIEYVSFADWKNVSDAKRVILCLSAGYFCAPQVFYFSPQKKWYMVLQVIDESRKPALQPAYSTTGDVSDPASWAKPMLLYDEQPENVKMWIDFWVICDEAKAHLFFTSHEGRMWRAETRLADFPASWSKPVVVLCGDIFEAGHTYRLKGLEAYLTVVEARAGGRRYYKAYLADRLDGQWRPLAASLERPFAAPGNVRFTAEKWTDSFSHGEMIRAGFDEKLEIDPERMRFVFQGVRDEDKAGKVYGQIPWRLGILEAVPQSRASE